MPFYKICIYVFPEVMWANHETVTTAADEQPSTSTTTITNAAPIDNSGKDGGTSKAALRRSLYQSLPLYWQKGRSTAFESANNFILYIFIN
jgi:hypothetical protein